ncbi:MAG: hypothetical protein ACREWJ_13595, partial [Rhodoferax sp.]
MSLDLDERRRAMLAEMNIRVWQPSKAADVVGIAVAAPSVPTPHTAVTVDASESIAVNAQLARDTGIKHSQNRAAVKL